MAYLDDLHSASFRGIPFLVSGARTTAGRKQAVHEYPDTDRRYVEDMGILQDKYEIEAIVHGVDWLQRRDSLRRALLEGGIGELVHPFYGSVQVVPEPHTVSERTSELGVVKFQLVFLRAEEGVYPEQGTSNLARVQEQADAVLAGVATDIAGTYTAPTAATNIEDTRAQIEQIADVFTLRGGSVTQVKENISAYADALSAFEDSPYTILRTPATLASRLTSLFETYDVIAADVTDQLNLYFGELFTFGDDDITIPLTTVERIERATNRKVLRSAVKTNSLALAYGAATRVTYENDEQLTRNQTQLETQYQAVVADNNLSAETLETLQSLRNEARLFFEREAVNVYKVTTVATPVMPLTVLAYQYYGDTSKTDALLSLNDVAGASFVEGNVKMLVA